MTDTAPRPKIVATTRRNGTTTSRVPPHDLRAEAALLGAMLLSPNACAAAVSVGIKPAHFYKASHGDIYRACIDLYAADDAVDPVTVASELDRADLLERAGGGAYLVDLQAGCPATSSAATYARTIDACARQRALISVAADIADLGYTPADDVDTVDSRVAAILESVVVRPNVAVRTRLVDGAKFLLDQPETITSVWGSGDTVLWAEGEATMIVGPTGIGKTTICQQVVLGRLGIRTEVLGQPVKVAARRVLYLAMDRPAQAARSMRRMVQEHDRELLEDLLVFWKGPPPFSVVDDYRSLARFAKEQAADTVVIDSLKDICHKLVDDEQASKTNAAMQECIAQGIEVINLHHQRKKTAGAKKNEAPKSIDDVYGNTWLTAGQGSVMLIWGEAGDPIVELSHLKPPVEQVGPWTLTMDFDAGYTTLDEEVSVLSIVNNAARGATAALVAQIIFKTPGDPSRNDVAKAYRKLERLVDQGLAHREDIAVGVGKPTATYFPIDTRRSP